MVGYGLFLFSIKNWNLYSRNKLHAILRFSTGSFKVHIEDHLRSNLEVISVWGPFAVLYRCIVVYGVDGPWQYIFFLFQIFLYFYIVFLVFNKKKIKIANNIMKKVK